ncbi:MAG TPA: hypothetical protein DEO38_01555 [Bacteroidales bacterium]|nr:hypothetical protein [Bacteroidales bacterium]
MKKTIIVTVSVILLIACCGLGGFLWYKYWFVFAEGVKAGNLNKVEYKGYIFKTYEGTLIQAGLKSGQMAGTVQSNEFRFSVVDKELADSLMRCSGKNVELHYKQYKGALPWRGMCDHVVDGIIAVSDDKGIW